MAAARLRASGPAGSMRAPPGPASVSITVRPRDVPAPADQRLADAGIGQRGVAVILQRNHAVQRQHLQRGGLPQHVGRVGIGGVRGRHRVGGAAHPEGPRHQQRDGEGSDQARRADPGAVGGRDVAGAGRQPRPGYAVAEQQAGAPIVAEPGREDARGRGRAVEGCALRPTTRRSPAPAGCSVRRRPRGRPRRSAAAGAARIAGTAWRHPRCPAFRSPTCRGWRPPHWR